MLSNFFSRKNVKPVFISIHWKNGTMTQYVRDLLQQLDVQTETFYLIGFSYGAMIALIASAILKPKRLYLCSLSPYFQEDLKHMSTSDRHVLGKKRIKDFSHYRFSKLAKNITCQTFLFAGTNEPALVLKRATEATKKIKDSLFIPVKHGTHTLNEIYLKEIFKKI